LEFLHWSQVCSSNRALAADEWERISVAWLGAPPANQTPADAEAWRTRTVEALRTLRVAERYTLVADLVVSKYRYNRDVKCVARG
jgi:hypothetical protein